MKIFKIILIILVAIIIFGGLYWWSSTHTVLPVEQTNDQVFAPVLNDTVSPTFGNFLTSPNGLTVYYTTKDKPGISNCYDACAVNWLPYIVSASDPLETQPILPGIVSTIVRTDGTLQLTYNGMPLYFWAKDSNFGAKDVGPHDLGGNNIGGVWFIVKGSDNVYY